MNRQNSVIQRIPPGGSVLNVAPDSAHFRRLLTSHLQLIERQCFNAVSRQLRAAGNPDATHPVNVENEALELANLVTDTLAKDDFKVLRQFKGNSKLSTYIITIIARLAVDLIRKKRGRSRQKERAQKLGDIGLLVYEKLCLLNYPVNEIHHLLLKEHGINASPAQIDVMIDHIKGRKTDLPADPAVKEAVSVIGESGNSFEVVDDCADPGAMMEEEQRWEQVGMVLKRIFRGLSGEEQLVLRMRFPDDPEGKAGSVGKIAHLLGISEKAAYKRITRILMKCRTLVDEQGIALDELL